GRRRCERGSRSTRATRRPCSATTRTPACCTRSRGSAAARRSSSAWRRACHDPAQVARGDRAHAARQRHRRRDPGGAAGAGAARIAAIRPGAPVGDISGAIEDTVAAAGFSTVREFVGHGIGRSLHEDPQVPNYRTGARGVRLTDGLVLAIEPMVNAGRPEVFLKEDGWTAATRDGRLSAHFEHSVAVTDKGPYILSLP